MCVGLNATYNTEDVMLGGTPALKSCQAAYNVTS